MDEVKYTEHQKSDVVSAGSEDDIIRIRKEKIFNFFKENKVWIYVLLAIIIYFAVSIRTSNLSGLRDVTTGDWTLGPDLDPFLFLRMASDIVTQGHLNEPDMMRYVPLGFHQEGEYLLLPYMIAYFHKVAVIFGSENITHSAILFPAFMFGITIIAFFFMTREMFIDLSGKWNANIIALISSFFLAFMPPLLPRTIAGIPEKESIGFMLIFAAIYFFIAAFRRKGKSGMIFAALSGIATALMAHTWGGQVYIYFTILPACVVAFLFGKFDKDRKIQYCVWLGVSFLLIVSLFSKYSIKSYLSSQYGALSMFFLLVIGADYILYNSNFGKSVGINRVNKIPERFVNLAIVSVVSLLGAVAIFGTEYVSSNVTNLYYSLIKPATSRLIQTVAENRQPYFTEWSASFGPNFKNILVIFWLMLAGSVFLFYNAIKSFGKKERIRTTLVFAFFTLALIFSRYSSSSTFNGENTASKIFLFGGGLIFIATFGYYYFIHTKHNSEWFKRLDFSVIALVMFYLLGLASARAGVRFIMVLVPTATIMASYLVVTAFNNYRNAKDKNLRILWLGFFVIILLLAVYAGNSFYKESKSAAVGFVPSIYTQQWQKAMSWVRENTPENAVFGHWWDYGYWLQSIGQRATVLDGGNAISYWNHMMGRYALTGTDEREALEFLYAHDTTHFLIDSTDIGKYSAFSSIGSNSNYDRASFIPAFVRDVNQVQEKKNSTVFLYRAGIGLDEDIIYDLNGTEIFLPAGQAGLGGIFIERNSSGNIISPPIGIFVHNGKQYELPLRYLHDGKFRDFGNGIESGVFLYPRVDQTSQGTGIERDGAMLYLSKRTVRSQLAKLYLYKEKNDHFKLVHSEDDYIIEQIKQQNPTFDSDFVHYGGLRGPIRIWEINYPVDIRYDEKYVDTDYPAEILYAT